MRARTRFQDRLFEHRLVQFKADLFDVAGLFIAHQVTRTTNVEIVARKLEPGAEAIEFTKHLQTLFSRFGQYAIRFMR